MKEEFRACVAKADVADGQGDVFTSEALYKAARDFARHRHLPVTIGFKADAEIIGIVKEITVSDDGMWVTGRFVDERMTAERVKQMLARHVFRICFAPKNSHVVEGCRVYDDIDILQIGFLPENEAVPLEQRRTE